MAKFGTLSACADLLFETAHYDDPVKGPQVLGFYLSAKTEGIKIQNNWDTLSIRSSASNDIVWENVFVPDHIVSARPARAWDPSHNVFSCWMPSLDACYVGLAEAARDWAINWTRDRMQVPFDRPTSHYPGNQFLAAEMEIGVRAARAMLIQTASSLTDQRRAPSRR